MANLFCETANLRYLYAETSDNTLWVMPKPAMTCHVW
jgi:hypothetical protein